MLRNFVPFVPYATKEFVGSIVAALITNMCVSSQNENQQKVPGYKGKASMPQSNSFLRLFCHVALDPGNKPAEPNTSFNIRKLSRTG